jgi:branched-chain amino acid transport system ATP-binding protein
MSPTGLEVRHLTKSYGGVQVVSDVSFAVARGERVALIGPNGAGKTTCFNMLNGQLALDSGEIALDGKPLTGLRPRDIWRRGVGRTFQITATFGSMTVRENVQVALMSLARRSFMFFGSARAFAIDDANALLARVGMLEQAERLCATLAYGDLKRVELALALANRPGLLLMDEPTAGMAPAERNELMELASQLSSRQGTAVLFTEHDMSVVFAFASRILVLHDGRLIASGTPEAVRQDPRVREVYLGDA